MSQKCTGIDALTGAAVAVTYAETIEAVEPAMPADGSVYLAPGFIDLQVNGFAGVDYNAPAAQLEDIGRSIRALYATGVTRFFPTVITGSFDDMSGALRNLANARERLPEGAAIEGFHIEGPHISPDDGPRGAHPRRWVRRPDLHELHRLQDAARGLIRLVTLSPEWPEATRYIEGAVREGLVVSIGHTAATSEQIAAAVSAGATMSTHLGNGGHSVLPRHPNYLWDQLGEDRLTASFIVDGIHLPASFLKAALRAKGPERRLLVTDAVMPAASQPGLYRIGEQEVELKPDNRVVLVGTTRLAGSALRMHQAVANLMRLAGLNLPEAIAMATVIPARAGRVSRRDGGIQTGLRGDLVEFRLRGENLEIEKTSVGGDIVYRRGESATL